VRGPYRDRAFCTGIVLAYKVSFSCTLYQVQTVLSLDIDQRLFIVRSAKICRYVCLGGSMLQYLPTMFEARVLLTERLSTYTL
jgi:hypothetical protein